jgi:L-alanine-DL-glutamate epimerase-like enolase superfamily enzyme
MPLPTDIRPVAVQLYFLPIKTRVPLKFGPEITTEVTCARVKLTVEDRDGKRACGWGETPLSVQWVWPSSLSYDERHEALRALCLKIAAAWLSAPIEPGHPMEVGHRFLEHVLTELTSQFNRSERQTTEPVPWLAALVCASAFDLALHDAYGMVHGVPTYSTYTNQYMNFDLAHYLEPAADAACSFSNRFPEDFLISLRVQQTVPAWHLIGGKDPIEPNELTGSEPDDGYPVLLRDWIRRDGLKCLKVKLRGDDCSWDYNRLSQVGQIAIEERVDWLTADFNCTVQQPEYVTAMLDRLLQEQPRVYGMLLYVEQPFPYDLEAHRIDVHAVSARKPLFMDESAHDWRFVRLGARARLVGGCAQDLQDTDRCNPLTMLGQGPRNDAHGPGPLESYARADPPRVTGSSCRYDHGRRVQRHAILPCGLATRGGNSRWTLSPPERLSRSVDGPRSRFWLSHR